MWNWGCLVPHPPIIIPEVGRGKEHEADHTIIAMKQLTEEFKDRIPDLFIVISPHNNYSRGLHFILAPEYDGNLGMFGVPEISMTLSGSMEKGHKLADILSEQIPVTIETSKKALLDHGSIVPLYYFEKQWKYLPPVILINPIGLSPDLAYKAGKLLEKISEGDNYAVLASGDLSHSLKRGAPGGFHNDGKLFDQKIVHAIENNDPQGILELPPQFLQNAAECGLRSVLVLMGVFSRVPFKVLSHEGPFGVGYCVAHTVNISSNEDHDVYVSLVKKTISGYIRHGQIPELSDMSEDRMYKPAGCFVTIRSSDGNLRGCIGTIDPVNETLAEEIIANAISAATKDPRFPSLKSSELNNITVSVDILSEPLLINDISELDPKIYGVIIQKGFHKGVLLPDLKEVKTVEQQLSIAAAKAGITSIQDSNIFKFTVERHSETNIH